MDASLESAVPPGTAEGRQRLVLFDFDGVLMRGDAYTRFVRSRLRRSWWRLSIALVAVPLLLPLTGIRSLRMPVAGVFVRIGLLGVGAARYREMARAFAAELVQRPRIFIRDGIAAMRRHVVDGDRVVIVTGCEETLARAIFEAIGLHDLEIIASRLREGRLGMRKDVHNIGARKPVQIAAHGLAETWDIAYSDSSRDIPMLRAAREAVLVNAGPQTVKRVEAALGRTVRRVDWF